MTDKPKKINDKAFKWIGIPLTGILAFHLSGFAKTTAANADSIIINYAFFSTISFSLWNGIGLAHYLLRKQLYGIKKIYVRGGKNVKVINKYANNINYTIKIVRLSEVYLIAAEASYQTGNIAGALSYLNQVATKRDNAFTGYISVGTQVLEDILTERRKELAFEGHRYWDLARNGRDVVRVNTNTNYPGNVPLTIAKDNFRRLLPLPQGELDANTNIKSQQNAGY